MNEPVDLVAAQETLGLTREALAQVMGVHRQTLAKWQRGEQKPPAVAVQMVRLLLWLHARGLFAAWRAAVARTKEPENPA
jgi:DNA-binding transcriptional regulator YiaG